MLKRILNRLKEKCGAATIEAVVAFTGFLFVIVTILNVANYCRAQMVISNAVDAAARELAQYSYFYNMTGMEKFNNYVNENAGIGAANINDVIDGTNSVYTTLSSALSDTTDYGNQLADKVDNQNLTYQDIQTAVLKIDTNSTNIMSSITAMEAKFSSVERNPLLYMKSLAAVASGEALDLAKSYVIAAPLAKLFTSTNINSGELSVQQYLENLGIVGGFEGLNFNTSTMFSPGEQDDIHLRCYYKISLCNFVDKSLFDIPICKEAHCRAWLGGDDNPVKVSQQAAVQPAPERSMPEQADASDVSGADVSGGETSGGEETSAADTAALIAAFLAREDEGEDAKALRELVAEVNAAGGADSESALDLLLYAKEYNVDFASLGLINSDGGKPWTFEELEAAGISSVSNYKEFERMLKIYEYSDDMTLQQKCEKIKLLYENSDYKTDITVPADYRYVESINEEGIVYKWPTANMGFADGYKPISRADGEGFPKEWDRYGYGGGNNFSDLPKDREKYSFSERSLPYIVNEDAYHKGTTNTEFYYDICDAMLAGDMKTVNIILEFYEREPIDESRYNSLKAEYDKYQATLSAKFPNGIDAPYGVAGNAAPAFGMDGGATQYFTPFSISTMEELGIMTEYKKP
ncbi:MAG: hypothetical protein J5717_03760 [Lachnospiraceae bacterium]|nr:hypothetical protein [Lachnospiraceae bacterium]